MTPIQRMIASLNHRPGSPIPRGELWIGSGVFSPNGCDADTLQCRINLCLKSGMDFLSLPVEMPCPAPMNYRRFSLGEIEDAVKVSSLFTCAVVDGPFQQLVNQSGLFPALTALTEKPDAACLHKEAVITDQMIDALVERGVNAVVIADDIAYQQSTYANPKLYRERLFPLYDRLVEKIRKGNAYALFHSDGNITPIIQDIISCGFDGLAGCEPECLDLLTLKETHGDQLSIMSGAPAGHLSGDPLSPAQQKKFKTEIQAVSENGGFILCSACGINSAASFTRLKTLYDIIDTS